MRKALAALALLLVAPYLMAPTGGIPSVLSIFNLGVGTQAAPAVALIKTLTSNTTATTAVFDSIAAGQTLLDFRTAGTDEAFLGTAGAVNQVIAGSGVGDFGVRTQGGNLLFSTNSGAGINWKIAGTGGAQGQLAGNCLTAPCTDLSIASPDTSASGVPDILVTRASSLCGTIGDGVDLQLEDTSGGISAASISECSSSAGVSNLEFWQFSGGGWIRSAIFGASRGFVMQGATGGDKGAGSVNAVNVYEAGAEVLQLPRAGFSGTAKKIYFLAVTPTAATTCTVASDTGDTAPTSCSGVGGIYTVVMSNIFSSSVQCVSGVWSTNTGPTTSAVSVQNAGGTSPSIEAYTLAGAALTTGGVIHAICVGS